MGQDKTLTEKQFNLAGNVFAIYSKGKIEVEFSSNTFFVYGSKKVVENLNRVYHSTPLKASGDTIPSGRYFFMLMQPGLCGNISLRTF